MVVYGMYVYAVVRKQQNKVMEDHESRETGKYTQIRYTAKMVKDKMETLCSVRPSGLRTLSQGCHLGI